MRSLIAGLLCLITLTALDAQLIRRRVYAAPPVTYRPPAQPVPSRLDQKVDGHVGYNSGEVAELPSDADKLCMVLVLSDDWENGQNDRARACRNMKAWLEADPRLIKYRKDSRFSFLLDSDPAYRGLRTLADGTATSLYAKLGDAYPILDIEKPNGEMIFKCSALSLPKNAGDLADRVTLALKNQEKKAPVFDGLPFALPIITEGGDCPDCKPILPSPAPDKSEVLEDTPMPSSFPWGGLAAAGGSAVALAGAGYVAARRPGLKR